MAYISHRRPSSARRPGARPPRRPKGNKQAIDPNRYVKAANPAQTADYAAQNDFADFAIHPLLKNNIAGKGYKMPSEITRK